MQRHRVTIKRKLAITAIFPMLVVFGAGLSCQGATPSMAWTFNVAFGTPTATATPTATPLAATPTFTPTPTASPTPIAVSTPFIEHFNATTIGQAGGWWNYDNCALTTSGKGSAKAIIGSSHDPSHYGWLQSNTMTMNISTNNRLRLVISAADSNVGLNVYLHQQGQTSGILVVTNPPMGATEYNIPQITGLSGSQTFCIEMSVSALMDNVGITFDEIWIYPASSTGFIEDFPQANTPPAMPPGWWDEYNVIFTANGTDSAYLVKDTPDNWGSTTSNTMTLNIDSNPIISVMVNSVDASTGNVLYVNNGAGDILIASGMGVGVHNYDLRTAPTNWSGSQTFHLRLVVQTGTAGTGTRFDGVTIGSFNQY